MAAGTWTLVNGARIKLLDGTFDLDSGTWKVGIYLSSSNIGPTSTTVAGLTNEHANANGYTTGGATVTMALAGTTSVTCSFTSNPSWTATGGSITGRWAVLHNGTNVLSYVLLDSAPADVTAVAGTPLVVDSDGTPAPVFTFA